MTYHTLAKLALMRQVQRFWWGVAFNLFALAEIIRLNLPERTRR